jgi:serine/threonine protein kinase
MPRASSPSIPPLDAGAILGDKFEVLGVLGEGGAGIVYDALRLPERERVALKVLHSHLLGDRQFRGRFEREATILRRLGGPHVCPVLDSGELRDPRNEARPLLYIALPKIEGPALDAVLLREGPLPLSRVFDIVLQILDALKMAHAQGIVHRDLKPANVLLRGGSHVVVVDFGLAKIVAGDASATVLTAHNMVCGTPEYMAPEQARGDEIDVTCDIYSAGVILYQMLTGSVPFEGPTPLSVLTAHLTSTPVPPRERAPTRGISPALEAVVLHALAKDPAERYATAVAMAAAILHARATPDDLRSVAPEAFRVHDDGQEEEQGLGETERREREDGEADPHAPTMPDLSSGRPPPLFPSSAPPGGQSTPTTTSTPAPKVTSRAPAPGATAKNADSFELGPRGWRVLWVVAAVASICVGVWLSLHAP